MGKGSCKIFRQKRTERLIFPRLHIARAPIIHKNKAEHVVDRPSIGTGSLSIAGTNQGTPFPIRVEAFGRTKIGAESIRRLRLPAADAARACRRLQLSWRARDTPPATHFQFGISAFSGPRSIVPTLCA